MLYKKIKKVKTPPVIIKATIKKSVNITPSLKSSNHVQRAKEFLVHLRKYFDVFQKYYPLMVGVSKELIPIFPEHSKRVINTALYLHTHSKRYLKNVVKGLNRVDLCGQVVSTTDKTSQHRAKKILTQLFKNDGNNN